MKGPSYCERAIADDTVQQPFTLYYRAPLAQALRQCGQAGKVVELLDDWFQLLDIGISTWPENDSPQARSDCHAWGCMPESEIVHSLFGIEMEQPGWASHPPAAPLGQPDMPIAADEPHPAQRVF